MEKTVYTHDYKDVDLRVNASKDAACVSMIEGLPALKRAVPYFNRLTEEQWAPFRSFFVLCNLVAIKLQARFELVEYESEDLFDAVMISRGFTLGEDDLESFTTVFQSTQAFTLEPLDGEHFAIHARYSFLEPHTSP